jgi:hypothetical protein
VDCYTIPSAPKSSSFECIPIGGTETPPKHNEIPALPQDGGSALQFRDFVTGVADGQIDRNIALEDNHCPRYSFQESPHL